MVPGSSSLGFALVTLGLNVSQIDDFRFFQAGGVPLFDRLILGPAKQGGRRVGNRL